MSNKVLYEQMFDYLSAEDRPTAAQPVLVFGRKDPRLAHAMGDLDRAGLATDFVISGGFGKDSGDLWDSRLGEARYVRGIAVVEQGVDLRRIHIEEKALVGSENARFGLRIMGKLGLLAEGRATAMAHATSLRRLAATAVAEATKLGLGLQAIHKVPTAYLFSAENPNDQREAASELLRLADWGEAGLIQAQPDLPEDLVAFARTVTATPSYPTGPKLAVLRRLPHRLKRIAMHA